MHIKKIERDYTKKKKAKDAGLTELSSLYLPNQRLQLRW